MCQVLQPCNHLGGLPLDHVQFFKVSLTHGLTHAEQSGLFISLDLLATGLQMWPRAWFAFIAARAHYSFMFSLLPAQTQCPFLQKMEGS